MIIRKNKFRSRIDVLHQSELQRSMSCQVSLVNQMYENLRYQKSQQKAPNRRQLSTDLPRKTRFLSQVYGKQSKVWKITLCLWLQELNI
ncbi:hypothetical protein FGIG_03747 [Fasciola gigantica]|uniref:Uncharacterized protein n=1 Tax=Fasciola gigantica TaxID=46835 RepID=A0A504YEZ1_FASGI|nr:hypothetical protein FGIG_03747 [Fasciola gigantica]